METALSMAEISNIKPTLQAGLNTAKTVGEDNKQQATEASGASVYAGTDKVSLSEVVSQFSQSLADASAVDSSRVAAIKQAIEEGSYQIDTNELAQNVLKFEGDL
jgi:negative regulator of flagellin synthesis FlgM